MFRSKPKLRPGDAAPVFKLPCQDGSQLDLVELRGKERVVLAFYPEDDTAGCTLEMCGMQARLARFQSLRTRVFGLSHNSSESQQRFARKHGLEFQLLSDPKGEVAKAYGAKGILPYFQRKTFVIDGRGVLRLLQDGQPKFEEILTFLEGLRGDLPEAT
jgi:peroxiredoxin Q/BCP